MTSTDSIAAGRERRAARFADLERRANGSAGWLRERRRGAFERFETFGFPTTRQEDWRHTDVGPIATTDFAAAPAGRAARTDVAALTSGDWTGPVLVFVNGRWAPDLSSTAGLPRGIVVQGLAAALAADAPGLEAHLARLELQAEQPFTALATAFLEDGAYVHLARGTLLETPLQLVFLAQGETAFECHPRILVVAEAESQATIVEAWGGRGVSWTNAVTEVVVGPGAIVTHARIQRESPAAFHVGRVQARLDRDSRFTSYSMAFGAALARTEVDVVFGAEGGECTLNGLYAADGRQHTDNRTFVDHARPHCTSNQLYKGVLAGTARGVFNGRVIVRPDAQKSDAHQTNRNLLLSEAALVDTKPQLEIYADDVQCTHGATIGRLDEAPLFYLQSRGIGRREAQDILTHAFARDVVTKARPESLRSGLEAVVAARLAMLTSSGGEA